MTRASDAARGTDNANGAADRKARNGAPDGGRPAPKGPGPKSPIANAPAANMGGGPAAKGPGQSAPNGRGPGAPSGNPTKSGQPQSGQPKSGRPQSGQPQSGQSNSARSNSAPSGQAPSKQAQGNQAKVAPPKSGPAQSGPAGSAGPSDKPRQAPIRVSGPAVSPPSQQPASQAPASPPPASAPPASEPPASQPPASPPPSSPPPRMRPPLPGPPPGMRMPGPPMPGGYQLAPPPAPRRRLTGGQRGKLFTLAVVLMLLGAALGYLVSLAVPTTYGAVTTIQYNIAGQNTGDFLKTDRSLTTQTVLLTSRNVLQPVADANGVNVDQLTKNTSATILNSSDIIQLMVKDQTPDGAVNLANAIAKQYIQVSNESSPRGYIQDQLTAVQKQLASPPATGNTPANTAALQARQTALQTQLDQMNLTSNQSTVLVPAYTLPEPVSPSGGGSATTGLICGALIALIAVITLSRRWTRN